MVLLYVYGYIWRISVYIFFVGTRACVSVGVSRHNMGRKHATDGKKFTFRPKITRETKNWIPVVFLWMEVHFSLYFFKKNTKILFCNIHWTNDTGFVSLCFHSLNALYFMENNESLCIYRYFVNYSFPYIIWELNLRWDVKQ